jgi:hypothetical protein
VLYISVDFVNVCYTLYSIFSSISGALTKRLCGYVFRVIVVLHFGWSYFFPFSCIIPLVLATSVVYLFKLHFKFQPVHYFAILCTGLHKLLIGKD